MRYLYSLLIVAFVVSACNQSTESESAQAPSVILIAESNSENPVLNNSVETIVATVSQTSENRVAKSEDYTRSFDNQSARIRFFERCAKPSQSFEIDPTRDTVLLCEEGTRLWIDAFSFCTEKDGSPVISPVTISIKEFYSLSDMIMEGLSTRAGDEILETGGMLYIEANSDEGPCELANGKSIDIAMPSEEKKDDMQLFTGEWTEENQMNWNLVEESYDLNRIEELVDTLAYFTDNEYEIKAQIRSLLQEFHPHSFSMGNETVELRCVVDRNGNIVQPELVKCSDPLFGEALADVVQKIKMRPAILNGQPVNSRIYLPFALSERRPNGYEVVDYARNSLYRHRSASGSVLSNKSRAMEITDYLFGIRRLGWINCDRFLNVPEEDQTDYVVDLRGHVSAAYASIVMRRPRSIVQGFTEGNSFLFSKVPKETDIKLVVVDFREGKSYLAIQQTNTSMPLPELQFTEVTEELLKEKLAEFK